MGLFDLHDDYYAVYVNEHWGFQFDCCFVFEGDTGEKYNKNKIK
jgi:hypothetical protein